MQHHASNTPIGRLRIETLEEGVDRCVATLPIEGLINPVTGAPSLGPLAVLTDHVAGLLNHHRRNDPEWTVSNESPASPPTAASARRHYVTPR